jgi:hypothetical protein
MCTTDYDACFGDPTCVGAVKCFVDCVEDGGGSGCALSCATDSSAANMEGVALGLCANASCKSACEGGF